MVAVRMDLGCLGFDHMVRGRADGWRCSGAGRSTRTPSRSGGDPAYRRRLDHVQEVVSNSLCGSVDMRPLRRGSRCKRFARTPELERGITTQPGALLDV